MAGYWGGWIDNLIMRMADVVLGFPALLLAIAIVAVLGPGLRNALLAIAIVTIPQYARVMRASVLQIKELDFVAASRALGASSWRILFSRVVPNALTPLVVLGTLGIASAILEAAGPRLSRRRSAATKSRMGHHAERREEPALLGATSGLLPGSCHHAGRPRVQPPW